MTIYYLYIENIYQYKHQQTSMYISIQLNVLLYFNKRLKRLKIFRPFIESTNKLFIYTMFSMKLTQVYLHLHNVMTVYKMTYQARVVNDAELPFPFRIFSQLPLPGSSSLYSVRKLPKLSDALNDVPFGNSIARNKLPLCEAPEKPCVVNINVFFVDIQRNRF